MCGGRPVLPARRHRKGHRSLRSTSSCARNRGRNHMPLPIFVSRNGQILPAAQAQVSVFNPPCMDRLASTNRSRSYEVSSSPLPSTYSVWRVRRHDLVCPCRPTSSTFGRWTARSWKPMPARWHPAHLRAGPRERWREPGIHVAGRAACIRPVLHEGGSAITFEGQRTLPTAKTVNTLVSFLAQRDQRAGPGVHEALLYHNGHLTEGSNSNLCVVMTGRCSRRPIARYCRAWPATSCLTWPSRSACRP